jgi:hypothetical protein
VSRSPLYTVLGPWTRWEVLPQGALEGALHARRRVARPGHRAAPVCLYHCDGEGCPAAAVETHCHYEDAAPRQPPAARCPLCRRRLRFAGYAEVVTLLPVRRAGEEEG